MAFTVLRAAVGLSFSIAGMCVPGLRRQELTSELPLGLEQLVEPLSHLFVREIFAPLQRFLSQLDGFNKASFLGEIAADRLLRKRIRVATSLASQLRELVLLFRGEMYFHERSVRVQHWRVNDRSILSAKDEFVPALKGG